MNKYAVIGIVCFLLSLGGCDKWQTKSNDIPEKNDLVFIGDENDTIGYYKSSLIRANDNITVWLHFPKFDKKSKKEIERLSELRVEISCSSHQIKMLSATDFEGKNITVSKDEKWDAPSPASHFYRVIIKVCGETKTAP